ncbi:hypothetical protein [Xanthobacter autotrophicus]|uniref:hypothetical protein n=1 Tax=Xanthobacter autotrophicus TaxID=280 RepID=UPI0024A75548|nr:hypothetical protein [Xanthobacter autotrophicus]MDI4658556.1 hypothetical protein [Xanthobacter autotrophicus]
MSIKIGAAATFVRSLWEISEILKAGSPGAPSLGPHGRIGKQPESLQAKIENGHFAV